MVDIKMDKDILLDVQDLKVHFPIKRGIFKKIVGYTKAVDGLNFFIREGETLGLVGESGCGKTTTGRSILRLIEPTSGDVYFRNSKQNIVSFTKSNAEQLKKLRKDMQMIFQDPHSSLNARMNIFDIIAEPMRVYKIGNRKSRQEIVGNLLNQVGLSPEHMHRYPNEFSGGQRQRIGIARSIVLNPKLIICDEPVSALDVSVQAQILNLLEDLQRNLGLTYLFIAHDLSVVHHISDRVAVMYLGKIVEIVDNQNLYQRPKHPYTEALMSAIPSPDPENVSKHILLTGDVPDPSNPPTGCYFHTRCKYAQDICQREEPELKGLKDNQEHFVACHYAEELELKPVTNQELAVHLEKIKII